jgi:hypothetical protein
VRDIVVDREPGGKVEVGAHASPDEAALAKRQHCWTVEEEEHPTTKAFVASLLDIGKDSPQLTWVNCGLCVDERGAANAVDGVKRGSPADFLKMALESTNTPVIPTK